MFRHPFLILAALFAGLAACTTTGQLTDPAQQKLQAVLDDACPLLADAGPLIMQANGNVQKAALTVSLACPPHPAPTNVIVVGQDLFAAYTILSPYLDRVRK